MTPPDAKHEGDQVTIYGTTYTLLFQDISGLWMVCETDNPNAAPCLKDIR